jgi:hypothetical protein
MLGAADDTDEEIRKVRLDKILHEAQSPITVGWGSYVISTFV